MVYMAKAVRIDELVEIVLEADRPLTEPDIAERYGVSRPSINRHREELQERPEIEHGKVGRAMAYWSKDETPAPGGGGAPPGEREDSSGGFLERLRQFSFDDDRIPLPGLMLILVAVALTGWVVGEVAVRFGHWLRRPFDASTDPDSEHFGAAYFGAFLLQLGALWVGGMAAIGAVVGTPTFAQFGVLGGVSFAIVGITYAVAGIVVAALSAALSWSTTTRAARLLETNATPGGN